MIEDSPVLSADMIAALRCPLCGASFHRTMACRRGHTFNIAKQGYVHMGTGRKLPDGDTAAMVEARTAVLDDGLFSPLSERLTQSVPSSARLIVDLGGGTGHYLAQVLRARPRAQGMVFDVSRPALRRAARVAGAVLTDTWGRLPLADGSVDVILNVFAPRNGGEMRRVLAPRGVLIVATPLPHHLRELRQAMRLLDVDEAKAQRLRRTLHDFDLVAEDRLEWTLELTARQARQLILMGPNAFHGDQRPPAMAVTAAVRVTTWTGRPLPIPADRRDSVR